MAASITRPVGLLLLISLPLLCTAQSGDRNDDEDLQRWQSRTVYACQNGYLDLNCSRNEVIRIKRANYGRFSQKMCNPHANIGHMNLNCQSATAIQTVSSRCDGYQGCRLLVNSDNFEDPCPGTSKYAEVQYHCEQVHSGRIPTTMKPQPPVPRWSVVPVPEDIRVCLHPMSGGSLYDLIWEMPESDQQIFGFKLKYKLNEELLGEDDIRASNLDQRFTYVFKPQDSMRSFEYQFALKALSARHGWGQYSSFVSAERCSIDGNGNVVTHIPISVRTTTTVPKDGGGLRQMCRGLTILGQYWVESSPDDVLVAECPSHLGQGVMYFKCLSNGVWDPNGPETGECRKRVVTTTTTQSPPPTTTTTTTSTTSTTTTTTTTTATTKPVIAESRSPRFNSRVNNVVRKLTRRREDQYNISSLLPALAKNMTDQIKNTKDRVKKRAMAESFKEDMLTLVEEVVRDDEAWHNMSVTVQRSTAATLLDSMEDTGLLVASTLDVGASNISRKANVVMKLMNIDIVRGEAAVLNHTSLGSNSKFNQFTIPSKVLRNITGEDTASVPVAFVVMSDLSEWLAPKAVNTSTNNTSSKTQQVEPIRRIINSDIVSATVSKRRVKNLVEPVVFLMEHRQVESVANPKCSFWDTDLGVWSSEGCWLSESESNKTHTTCKCNHLTSFAVLMDITGATQGISAEARFSLELLTYIGCIISILCLLLSWVTFACFKNLDCDRNTIHKHLVFCLMVAQIVLVTGLQQTQPPVLCSIIAGILHYFFLASFSWMCLEGVQLYVMLIEVFESERSRVLYYYLFGYGVPAVIVTISAAVFSGGYGTPFHCWLTIERGFIWSFVGPALAVLLMNMVMLGIAIFIMVRHSAMSHTMRQKSVPQKMSVSGSIYSVEVQETVVHRPEIPTWVKGAVVLVVLLGLTWVFGVLYLDNVYHTLIFSYIFTILNTLQGLFIFLFHCLLNEKVRKEYRRLLRHTRWLPDCVRVRYGGASSSDSRENTSSGNMVARFFRGKKRHSESGDSSSNSAKPFLRKDQRHLSSSVPSSSDGATSSRLSSETSNNNNRKNSRSSSTFRSNGSDTRFLRPVEVSGIAGELSEILDCSVVDSEFVSEYCQQNLQVIAENKRYSTASEDSGKGEGGEEDGEDVGHSLDRLAALSTESLSKRQSHCASTSDLGEGDESERLLQNDVGENTAAPERGTFVGEVLGSTVDEEEDDDEEENAVQGAEKGDKMTFPESQQLVLKQTDSERVLINNAVNKPREMGQSNASSPRQSPSLTHINLPSQEGEEGETPPSHTSVPCLKFKPGKAAPPATTDGDQDTVMNSLPNLSHAHCNGTGNPSSQDAARLSPSVKRHSSDGRMYFSPFRFSGSEC